MRRAELPLSISATVAGLVVLAGVLITGVHPLVAVAFGVVLLGCGVFGLVVRPARAPGSPAALLREGIRVYGLGPAHLPAALDAWRRVAGSGNSVLAAHAEFYLGVGLSQLGDAAGAAAAYRRALDAGIPAAAVHLGALLEAQGDPAAAMPAYQRAAGSGDPLQAPLAYLRMATLLAAQDDVAGALRYVQQALDFPPAGHTLTATYLLASLAQRAGRPEQARTALTRLAASDDPQFAARGRAYLAMLAVAGGSSTVAEQESLRAAAQAGDPLAVSFLRTVQQRRQAS